MLLAIFLIQQAAPQSSTLSWVLTVWSMMFFSMAFIDAMLVLIFWQLGRINSTLRGQKR